MREQDKPYEVGKGKPPKHTRFGQPGANAQGKTSEQKRLEMLNAEAAMRIRARMLEAVERKLMGDDLSPEEADAAAIEFVEAAMLKLLKDSEDRGLGSPLQPVDHTSTDGSMAFPKIERIIVTAEDAAKSSD